MTPAFFLFLFVPVSFVPDGSDCIARYDYLVIETSGVSDPESIVRALDKTFGKLTRARCAAPACSSVSTAVLSRSCTQQPAVTCVSSVLNTDSEPTQRQQLHSAPHWSMCVDGLPALSLQRVSHCPSLDGWNRF